MAVQKVQKSKDKPIYKPKKNIKLLSTTACLFPVIHSGLGGCFEIAFYLTKNLKKGKAMIPGNIIMCDGYMPYKDGERVCCSSCGKLLDRISDKNGEYEVF